MRRYDGELFNIGPNTFGALTVTVIGSAGVPLRLEEPVSVIPTADLEKLLAVVAQARNYDAVSRMHYADSPEAGVAVVGLREALAVLDEEA